MSADTHDKLGLSIWWKNLTRVKIDGENARIYTKRYKVLTNTPKDNRTPRQMLTVNEVAHLLHVHPNTVRLWSKLGTLKSYRIGKRRDYRFNLTDVETFLYKDNGRSD
jgi:excisionase family DNA binding protein